MTQDSVELFPLDEKRYTSISYKDEAPHVCFHGTGAPLLRELIRFEPYLRWLCNHDDVSISVSEDYNSRSWTTPTGEEFMAALASLRERPEFQDLEPLMVEGTPQFFLEAFAPDTEVSVGIHGSYNFGDPRNPDPLFQ